MHTSPQGSFDNLSKIKAAGVGCPLLAKEFVVEAYQVHTRALAHARMHMHMHMQTSAHAHVQPHACLHLRCEEGPTLCVLHTRRCSRRA
jgi:hypothetical protein